MVPTSPALPREQRGWCGAGTGTVLILDVPRMGMLGLAAAVGMEGMGFLPSSQAKGVRLPLCLVAACC